MNERILYKITAELEDRLCFCFQVYDFVFNKRLRRGFMKSRYVKIYDTFDRSDVSDHEM